MAIPVAAAASNGTKIGIEVVDTILQSTRESITAAYAVAAHYFGALGTSALFAMLSVTNLFTS